MGSLLFKLIRMEGGEVYFTYIYFHIQHLRLDLWD